MRPDFGRVMVSFFVLLQLESIKEYGGIYMQSLKAKNKQRQLIRAALRLSEYEYRQLLEDELINKIFEILSHNVTNYDLITLVADEVNLSKDYVSKKFKSIVGINLISLIIRVKVEESKYLLLNTDMMIYEISELLGYATADYFTKLFKKVVGVTPNQYKMLDGCRNSA